MKKLDWKKIPEYFKTHFVARQVAYAVGIFFGIYILSFQVLNLYTRHGRSFSVPDFSGLSINEARLLADDNDLKFQILDSVFDRNSAPGTIVDQNPKPGFQVKSNRNVFFIVNALNPEMIRMPNVMGVSLRQAQSIITSSGLEMGTLRYVPDIADNNVLKQEYKGASVAPGTEIQKGARIDLVLGQSSGGDYSKVPSVIGLNLSKARSLLTEAFLNTGSVVYDETVKSTSDSINAMIYKQSATTSAAPGAFIDLWLTVDADKLQSTPNEVGDENY